MTANKQVTDEEDRRAAHKMATERNGTSGGRNGPVETSKDQVEAAVKEGVTTMAPPDGGWGWVVVMASFGVSVLVDGVCLSIGIFFDEFRNEFGTSKATTSWIGSVLNGSYLMFGPITSAFVNMYGCRKVAMIGSVLAFLSFFVSTFSPNIGVLIVTYGFFGGLGFGLTYLPAIVMVGYYFERRRALATGLACCGSGIGAFLFAPFSEYLLKEYGWRGANWILAALVLHGLALSTFYRPLLPQTQVTDADQVATGQAVEEAEKLLSPSSKDALTVDSTGNTKSSRVGSGEQRMPVLSHELRAQIVERLKSDGDLPPVYISRGRTMSMHSPEPSTPYQNASGDASKTARLAFSQDLATHQRKGVSQGGPGSIPISMPPLQRKDIFYSGSLWQLKEFKEVETAEEYRRKVSVSTSIGAATASGASPGFVQSFISVFDISLLKSPTFLIYGASCILSMLGFFVPFLYLPTHALDMGIDTTGAAFLISIIGIANTVGRVAVGFVSDQPWADCLVINNSALILGGLATLFVPYYFHYHLLAIYAAVFGSAIAIFISLRSIIMVELMGLDKLTTAFGFVIMCQGISSLLGPPFAGAISDLTGNYDASFQMGGIALTLGGLICLPIRRVARWENSRKHAAGASFRVVSAEDASH